MTGALASYKKHRNIKLSKEPKAILEKKSKKLRFVIHKHNARSLHYDFRIEINGVLKSWAVPKNLPLKPKVKHLAILTDDHPMGYLNFKGVIPKGQYGAGTVEIYDKGFYENIRKDKKGKHIPLSKCFKEGFFVINLQGKKVKGWYALICFKENNWLIFKKSSQPKKN